MVTKSVDCLSISSNYLYFVLLYMYVVAGVDVFVFVEI